MTSSQQQSRRNLLQTLSPNVCSVLHSENISQTRQILADSLNKRCARLINLTTKLPRNLQNSRLARSQHSRCQTPPQTTRNHKATIVQKVGKMSGRWYSTDVVSCSQPLPFSIFGRRRVKTHAKNSPAHEAIIAKFGTSPTIRSTRFQLRQQRNCEHAPSREDHDVSRTSMASRTKSKNRKPLVSYNVTVRAYSVAITVCVTIRAVDAWYV